MATPIQIPKLGNTVEECVLTAWHKQKGDAVTAGEVIADIETDKTAFELTAPTDGVILETFFEAGALVPVFGTACVIGAAGESAEAFRPRMSAAETQTGSSLGRAPSRTAVAAAPRPREEASRPGVLRPPRTASQPTSRPPSPRARRLIYKHDLNAQTVAGSGPGGRVLESDVRQLLSTPLQTSAPGLEDSTAAPSETVRALASEGTQTRGREVLGTPLSSLRDTIAGRLRENLSSTAQYTLHGSANAAGLLAARGLFKASADTAEISIGVMVIFCSIQALLETPDLNAELIHGTVYRHSRVHMAFACDTPRGLLAPVIRDSQNLSLRGLSRRIQELTAQAVHGVIAADDLSGGSFTVSNLGGLGVESFTPLLNPPQVAILGVDAINLKPMRKRDGNIEFIDSIGLSLTIDHQVIDGAPGARFLGALKAKIEAAAELCTSGLVSPPARPPLP
jgi:pyruvate dehydrogenase E2 component (dihydrolipoamide acetyltransferase)